MINWVNNKKFCWFVKMIIYTPLATKNHVPSVKNEVLITYLIHIQIQLSHWSNI